MSDNVWHLSLCGFRFSFPEISELSPLTTSLVCCLPFFFFNIFPLSQVSNTECHCLSTACVLMQRAGEPSPDSTFMVIAWQLKAEMNFTKTLICRDLDSSVATVQQFYGRYWYFGCWRGKFSDSTTLWRLLTPPVWQRIDWKGAQTDPDEQGFKFDTNLQFDLKVTREARRSEVAWAPHLRRVWGGYLQQKINNCLF